MKKYLAALALPLAVISCGSGTVEDPTDWVDERRQARDEVVGIGSNIIDDGFIKTCFININSVDPGKRTSCYAIIAAASQSSSSEEVPSSSSEEVPSSSSSSRLSSSSSSSSRIASSSSRASSSSSNRSSSSRSSSSR